MRCEHEHRTLNTALQLKGFNVTSAYPIECVRREWNSQEERMAKSVDSKFPSWTE